MAIDFLIFGLLLISFTINLLALGAFWVTPGLRTTANRFVINLLIVNLIGCFLLAPTLFLSGNYFASSSIYEEEKTIQKITKNENHLSIHRNDGQIIEEEDIYQNDNDSRTREMFVRCNSSYCNEMTIDETENRIVMSIEDFDREEFVDDDQPVARPLHIQQSRSWSLDLAAALGALSVLLVVGDTWCAITDPLRYHSRISGLKAWILIAIIWLLGILFGALSALRETVFETTIVKIHKTAGHNGVYGDEFLLKSSEPTLTIGNENVNIETTLYNSIFSYSYFIVIILLPFGCVCGMYWRIISEARENGLRMRQNGSSPLLQSALNLSQHNNAHNNILCNQRSSISGSAGGGLQMRIDNINHQLAIQTIATQSQTQTQTQTQNTHTNTRRCSFEQDNNILKSHLPIGIQTLSDNHHNYQYQMQSNGKISYKTERNQNILLTLSAASQEIKRNYSARQLPILDASQDINDSSANSGIRQIQSTPNLHRPTAVRKNSLNSTCIETSPHHVLQIPTIHASPKALSYMTSIRHRLSNASSLFKYREESRAARISILVVIMFLVSYLPYGLLVLLEGRILNNFTHSTQLEIFVVLLGNLSAPFIFAYRNKRVRRGVKRLFGLDARSKERRLQRNGGLSCGGATKHSINVRRSTSKVSTYSVNSCKYLTPHPIANANCANTIHPNSIYINNINNNNNNNNNNNSNNSNNNINNTTFQTNNVKSNNYSNNLPSIIKQDTIIEHIPLENDSYKNRSILKMFCYSSRKLGCVDNLPAEV